MNSKGGTECRYVLICWKNSAAIIYDAVSKIAYPLGHSINTNFEARTVDKIVTTKECSNMNLMKVSCLEYHGYIIPS